jgi:hypothetical protein
MADKKISALTGASTPLAGTEVLPIVQSGSTVKVSVANLTAGRTTSMSLLDVENAAGGGVLGTFKSNWSNTKVAVEGDGATGAGVLNISNAAATAALPFKVKLNGTEVIDVDTSGNAKATIGNFVIGTTAKGITTGSAISLGFGTNGSTTQGILDTDGSLLVGYTSKQAAATGSIQVNGSYNQIVIGNTTAGTGQHFDISMSQFATLFVENNAGAGVYLTYGATSWTSTSDINEKNVTGRIEDGLAKVNTLTPARFTWKSDEANTPQVGLIAQEVQAVLPEVVADNGDGVLGVRYVEVIPLLVAAIQELSARVEALEGQ